MAYVKRTEHKREFILEKEDGSQEVLYFTNSWKPTFDAERVFGDVEEVSGATYDIKHVLKKLGFKWDPYSKSWKRMSNEDAKKLYEKARKEKEVAEMRWRWNGIVKILEKVNADNAKGYAYSIKLYLDNIEFEKREEVAEQIIKKFLESGSLNMEDYRDFLA